jgi:predicted AlkP superfamily pyrophosphatase or phosphodiesterase
VAARGLGRDDAPDLLALSISGTDCAGHIFGPDSWEYVDHLARVDRALGQWLAELARQLPLAVLITSDHGVAQLPERQVPASSARLLPRELKRAVEAKLEQQLGTGPWVAGILSPFVYLTARARAHADPARVQALAGVALLEQPGIRDAFPCADVRAWSTHTDPVKRALALGLAPSNPCDWMLVPQPNLPLELGETEGKGTNHGSPYAYDREVPVLAWGAGVPRRRSAEPVEQLRVAATLAKLLGVSPPPGAAREPLF